MLKLPKGLLKLEKNSLEFFECDRSRERAGPFIIPEFLRGCTAVTVGRWWFIVRLELEEGGLRKIIK